MGGSRVRCADRARARTASQHGGEHERPRAVRERAGTTTSASGFAASDDDSPEPITNALVGWSNAADEHERTVRYRSVASYCRFPTVDRHRHPAGFAKAITPPPPPSEAA